MLIQKFGTQAPDVEIVETGSTSRRYRVLGFVAADVSTSDPARGLLLLRVKALEMGGHAISDVKNELMTAGFESSTRGGSVTTPVFGSGLTTGGGSSTTRVQNLEHWTAKVIAWEPDAVSQ